MTSDEKLARDAEWLMRDIESGFIALPVDKMGPADGWSPERGFWWNAPVPEFDWDHVDISGAVEANR